MLANKNIQNMPPTFCCEKCDYVCSKKSSWEQHLMTAKHTKANFELIQANKEYACEKCTIKFKHQSSYCRHKKKCQETTVILHKDEPTDKELIVMLLKQNTQLIEQNAELTKNGIHNTISHNTNSLNKTFNLQFFLNETCKDAMNIMEFVDSIKLQLTDLEKVGDIGYVEGISNIITTNLKALDVTQRPIHCTDKKRETLYIKDEDKWEKENEEKKKLRKAIKKVATKNIRLLQKFKELHPDCGKSASKFSDQYNKIIIESMDTDIENENKIIKNISKNVTIDKE
jgi:ATP-dependent Clp protease adapter protein ClpS